MTTNSYLDCIDSYTLQNVAQYLTPDQRDVGALRETCKYAASVIAPDKFIQKISAQMTIIRIICERSITPEQLVNLVRKYPIIFCEHMSDFIMVIKHYLSGEHLIAFLQYIIAYGVNLNRVPARFIHELIKTYIISNCDETVHTNIISIIKFIHQYDEIMATLLENITHIVQHFNHHKPATVDEFNAIIKIYDYTLPKHLKFQIDKQYIETLICEQFCGGLIINPEYAVEVCSDARRAFHIIDEYGFEFPIISYERNKNLRDITAFWHELRALLNAKYGSVNGAATLFAQNCAKNVNDLIDIMYYHLNDEYRAFWRDVFMIDGGFDYMFTLSYSKNKIINAIIQICNVTDLENIFINGSVTLGDICLDDLKSFQKYRETNEHSYMFYDMHLSLDVFAWICNHGIYNLENVYDNIKRCCYEAIYRGIDMDDFRRILIKTQPNLVNFKEIDDYQRLICFGQNQY